MNIKNKADLSRISNNYNLKLLFSYLDSNRILKIVKNNKKLQNKLNINIENYKKKSEFPKYEFIDNINVERIPMRSHFLGGDSDGECARCISTCTTSIFFIYLLIYAILLITLDTFDDSNTKKNYDKSLENIINKINIYLFILIGCLIVSWAILFFFIYIKCFYDYGFKKILKSILIIIINIIPLVFEGLVIWKLVISYKIIEGDIPWFMKMDYAFLSINFVHILFSICLTVIFFIKSGSKISVTHECYLTSFNNMNIQRYDLPDNFSNWTEKERKKFVLYKFNQFSYEDIKVFLDPFINIYRQQLNIPELKSDEDGKIPNFIINEPSEIMLYPEKNIFKLSNKEYLFKFSFNEFRNKIWKKDKEVLDILLKDNLEYIKYIKISEKDEYFLVYEKSENKRYYRKKFNKNALYEDDINIEMKKTLLDEDENE